LDRRVAAAHNLGTADAMVGESPLHTLYLKIHNRHAEGKEVRFCASLDWRQRKEVGACADAKYDGIALPNRRTKQLLVKGSRSLQVRNRNHHVVQAPSLNWWPRRLR
jgi:hypothetical protein